MILAHFYYAALDTMSEYKLYSDVAKHWVSNLDEIAWETKRSNFHRDRDAKYNEFTGEYPDSVWLKVNYDPKVGVALHKEEVVKEIDELYGSVCHESDIEVLLNHKSFSQAYNKLFPFFSRNDVVFKFLKDDFIGLASGIDRSDDNSGIIQAFCGCVGGNCATNVLLRQLRILFRNFRGDHTKYIEGICRYLGGYIDDEVYHTICRKLKLRVLMALPFIPEDHVSKKDEAELNTVQLRRKREKVESFNQFVRYEVCSMSYHLTNDKIGWMNGSADQARDPRNENRKTMKLVDNLANIATSVVGLPPNSEVMVYYTGHSSPGGRWHLAFEDSDNKWSRMALQGLYESEEIKRALEGFTQFWGTFDQLSVLQNIVQKMIADKSAAPNDGKFSKALDDHYDEHVARHLDLAGYFALLAYLLNPEYVPIEMMQEPAIQLLRYREEFEAGRREMKATHNQALASIKVVEVYQKEISATIDELRDSLSTLATKQKDSIVKDNGVKQDTTTPLGGGNDLNNVTEKLETASTELVTECQEVYPKVGALVKIQGELTTELEELHGLVSIFTTSYNDLTHSVNNWLESRNADQRRMLANNPAQLATGMGTSATKLAIPRDRLENLVRKRVELDKDGTSLVKMSNGGLLLEEWQDYVAELYANQKALASEMERLRVCLKSSTKILAGFKYIFQGTVQEELVAKQVVLLGRLPRTCDLEVAKSKSVLRSCLLSIAVNRERFINTVMEIAPDNAGIQNYLEKITEKRKKQVANREKLREYLVSFAEEQKVLATNGKDLKTSFKKLYNCLSKLEKEMAKTETDPPQEAQITNDATEALNAVDKIVRMPFFLHLKPVARSRVIGGADDVLFTPIRRIVEDHRNMATESDKLSERIRNLEQSSEEIQTIHYDITSNLNKSNESITNFLRKFNLLMNPLTVLSADRDELGTIGRELVNVLVECKLDIEELEEFLETVDSTLSALAARYLSSYIEDEKQGYFYDLSDYLMEPRAGRDGIHPELLELSKFHLNRAEHYEQLAKKDKAFFEGVRKNSGEALKNVLSKLLDKISIDKGYLVRLACQEEIKHMLRNFIKLWIKKDERQNYHLKFLLDTCHSGNWVVAFQRIIADEEFEGIEKFPISIQAACGPDEEVDLGFVVSTIRGHKWKQFKNKFTPVYHETRPIESPMIPELTMD